jgi:hypothetical protein
MTLTNAKIYVSRIVGGASNSSITDMAGEAIMRAYEDWEVAANWSFLLTDNSKSTTVANVITTASADPIPTPSVGAFDGINVGVTMVGTGINTTVSAVTRDGTTGRVTSVTPAASVSANTTPGVTVTFGGYIPLRAASSIPYPEYSAPVNFRTRYHAKSELIGVTFDYVELRLWYKLHPTTAVLGLPTQYTVNYGTKQLYLYPHPNAAALGAGSPTLLLQYYRSFDRTATSIDIPDTNLYRFLDYAQWHLLQKKNLSDSRLAQVEATAKAGLAAAVTEDGEGAQENSLPLYPLSMALAKRYVAATGEGESDPRTLGVAGEAILRAYEDWEAATNWSFLLTNTSYGFSVPSCLITSGSTTIVPPFVGAFDGVNKGVSVSSTSTSPEFVAGTVATVIRTPNGHITAITISTTPSITTTVLGATLVFGASTAAGTSNIPLAATVGEYSAPANFRTAYHAKLTASSSVLDYVESRIWYKVHSGAMTATTAPLRYTVNYGTKALNIYPIPTTITAADTIFLQYYRTFDKSASNIDISERNLYRFLDYARLLFIKRMDSTGANADAISKAAQEILSTAVAEDAEVSQENSFQTGPMSTMMAKRYVASIVGGEADPKILGQAGEAILRTYQDWQAAKFWNFLLIETSSSATTGVADDLDFTAGTNEHAAPADFNAAYTARLTGTNTTELTYIDKRYWDKNTSDQTIRGIPRMYTTSISHLSTTLASTTNIRIFPTPNATYTVRLRYYRQFNVAAANIDVPNEYLYKFLDYARAILLEAVRAVKDPSAYLAMTKASFDDARQNDEQPDDDDDGGSCLRSPYEQYGYRGPIVGDGIFDNL